MALRLDGPLLHTFMLTSKANRAAPSANVVCGFVLFGKSITIRGSGKVELSRREYRTLTRIVVRVRESRHHLIQRLFESVGITVARASRRSFGPVLLGSLERRSFRYLTLKEIKALKRGVRERR